MVLPKDDKEIRKIKSLTMDSELEATRCGKFGYETFHGHVIIPYIYRSSEKYCASSIFWWHFNKQNVKLSANLIDFGYLKKFDMHSEEVRLWNDINEWHNDSLYPITFCRKDTLVKLEDVRDIFKYINDCRQKLELGTQFEMISGGIVRIRLQKSKSDVILPYLKKNARSYVPVRAMFELKTVPQTLDVTKLRGIDVMYMRFLFDVLKMKVTIKQFKVSCVHLDQLVAYLQTSVDTYDELDDNYWPSKGNIRHKVSNNKSIFSSICSNNNSVEKSKVPVEQKRSADVKLSKNEEIAPKKRKIDEPKKPKKDNKQSTADDDFYDVDKILDYKQLADGTEHVLIRWTGYTSDDDSWEPLGSLNDALREDVKQLREKWTKLTQTTNDPFNTQTTK